MHSKIIVNLEDLINKQHKMILRQTINIYNGTIKIYANNFFVYIVISIPNPSSAWTNGSTVLGTINDSQFIPLNSSLVHNHKNQNALISIGSDGKIILWARNNFNGGIWTSRMYPKRSQVGN